MTYSIQPGSIRDMLTSTEAYRRRIRGWLALHPSTHDDNDYKRSPQATVCSCVERPDVYSKSLHESDRIESLDLRSAMSDQTDIQRDRVAGKADDRILRSSSMHDDDSRRTGGGKRG